MSKKNWYACKLPYSNIKTYWNMSKMYGFVNVDDEPYMGPYDYILLKDKLLDAISEPGMKNRRNDYQTITEKELLDYIVGGKVPKIPEVPQLTFADLKLGDRFVTELNSKYVCRKILLDNHKYYYIYTEVPADSLLQWKAFTIADNLRVIKLGD
jgi:hypothetical protein